MKLRELYSKPIERHFNPAVSATKFDDDTTKVEIEEYVFTDEILNGLYGILDAIKNNVHYHHVGIWIDGYYGSGKSHFLKYLDYCITPSTREQALSRLAEAVEEIDPFDGNHNLNFDKNQLQEIAGWLRHATIDTCIFNLETSNDSSVERKNSFLQVFWNEFNGKRGLNKYNISLAQNLEKPLQQKGVFEQFKQRIAEEMGADWNNPAEAADIIDMELDSALDIAKEVVPTLDKESIRQRIIRRDTVMSIERFANELADYLKDKGNDYRLIFLADEVSQFINKERDRYLNLQEIITRLSEACKNKIWVACTAQQELDNLLEDCNIVEEKDKEGKIMGRFEVKVSLKGTQPEVITQKRILDKKETVKPALEKMYDNYKDAFATQLKLPKSYDSYVDQDSFVAYYPFVPYQFKLIMQVFNSFLELGYVVREVKGNERSIIKVVHSTAKNAADADLGKFISFDELYNNMFEQGLQTRGQKAVNNAIGMARAYDRDPKLAIRVANTLFMVCNIAKTDKLLFPATLDYVTSLLISDMTTTRLNLKNEVQKILEYFCDNNIIRLEQGKKDFPDTYTFYSEEEMKVAQIIKNQVPDNQQQAYLLKDIFSKYITSLKNKETYGTRSFSVCLQIKNRTFLTNNNPDIVVELNTDNEESAYELSLQIPHNRMVFYAGPQYRANKRLLNSFYWVCQVNCYLQTPVQNEKDKKIREDFSKRAKELLETFIAPEINKIVDTCPIVSGQTVMEDPEISTNHGNERYKLAVGKHLGSIYTKAKLVGLGGMPTTAEELKKAILRNVESGDYEGMNSKLTRAEEEVELYLGKQDLSVNLADVVNKFSSAPYGWDMISTLYVVNELVRRHKRDYHYMNEPDVETATVAAKLLKEQSKFSVRKAKAISSQLVKDFQETWKDIFSIAETFGTNDSRQVFNLSRSADNGKGLLAKVQSYKQLEAKISHYPFATPVKDAVKMFNGWLDQCDPETYFKTVTAQREEAKTLMDRCKKVVEFCHDQMGAYESILKFLQDNEYNFQFLPRDYDDLITSMKDLPADESPMDNMTKYRKRMKTLQAALEDVRKSLCAEIRQAYFKVFDQLEVIANENQVQLCALPDRESIVCKKTSTSNLLMLKNNLSTDSFYQEMVGKILKLKPKVQTQSESVAESQKAVKNEIKMVSLNTKTKSALCDENDIDLYLSGLKEQLVKLLEGTTGIMVVK